MNTGKIAVAGLGLIGGSLVKTIKRKHPDTVIYGIGREDGSAGEALRDGTADEIFPELTPEILDCDILFLCAPIPVNIKFIERLSQMRKDAGERSHFPIITDVSSIKKQIHSAVDEYGLSDTFIGGHPMAGTEKTGYRNSQDHLLENVYYIVTPTDDTDDTVLSEFTEYLKGLDVIPVTLSVSDHDFATACVSHVPHIISAGLVNLVRNNDTPDHVLKAIAAGGFKDITRISSSSSAMWTAVSEGNSEKILPVLDEYIESLKQIKREIEASDTGALSNYFENAKEYRDSIETRHGGVIPSSFGLFCDVVDEEGEIATIATRLATHHISIKNIGIVHNREFENGALSIEFYDQKALDEATELLKKFRYTVYERN